MKILTGIRSFYAFSDFDFDENEISFLANSVNYQSIVYIFDICESPVINCLELVLFSIS